MGIVSLLLTVGSLDNQFIFQFQVNQLLKKEISVQWVSVFRLRVPVHQVLKS